MIKEVLSKEEALEEYLESLDYLNLIETGKEIAKRSWLIGWNTHEYYRPHSIR